MSNTCSGYRERHDERHMETDAFLQLYVRNSTKKIINNRVWGCAADSSGSGQGQLVYRFLICCWPCSLVMISFRFQLNAQYFISIVMFLYMFRALLCPSSGGPLYIYNIWFYVSLFWWPCTVTKRDWHRTRCCIQGSSWGWAQKCPKHVEEHNYRNKILRIKLESEVNYWYLRIFRKSVEI